MQKLVAGQRLVMRRPSLAVAAALLLYLGMAGTVLAQPTFRDYMGAYQLLEQQAFSQVESLYAAASQQPATNSSRNGAESFFSALRARSGGMGGNTPEATAAWGVARQWVQASPTSVPAAIFMGRLAVRDAPANRDWAAQERQTAEAIQALDKVKEPGRKDPMWNATYVALQTMGGATPAQTLALVKAHLPAMSEPGEMFFEEVVTALNLKSTDALPQLRELADLAVQRTAKSRGKGMHAVIYLSAFFHAPALRLAPFRPGVTDWNTMDTALTDLVNHRPSSTDLVQHAAMACVAQDKKRTTELMGRAPGTNGPEAAFWRAWGGEPFYERCKAWAFGRQVPA